MEPQMSQDMGPSEQPQSPEGVQPQTDVPTDYQQQEMPQDDLRARIEQEKEIYRQKQLMKKKERELTEREQQLSKPKNVDELLDEILNSKDEPEAKKEEGPVSQEEIIARAKEEIYRELQEQREQEEQESMQTQAVQEFTGEVGNFVLEHADRFPLTAELGIHEQISNDMMEELTQLEEEYGEEYAEKWFNAIDWEEHIAHYENNLANNFKMMIKSDRIRNLLRSYLGDENEMPTGEPPKTLSKENFSGSGGTQKDLMSMSVDERIAYAKAQLRKQQQAY